VGGGEKRELTDPLARYLPAGGKKGGKKTGQIESRERELVFRQISLPISGQPLGGEGKSTKKGDIGSEEKEGEKKGGRGEGGLGSIPRPCTVSQGKKERSPKRKERGKRRKRGSFQPLLVPVLSVFEKRKKISGQSH